MPGTPQPLRWFLDENSLGVAKALAYVRGDVTWPGAPGGPVPVGAKDLEWLPVIGKAGLIVLTRDKRIRSRTVERRALLDHGVRACFLTSDGTLNPSISFSYRSDTGPTSKHSSPNIQRRGLPASPRTASASSTGQQSTGTRPTSRQNSHQSAPPRPTTLASGRRRRWDHTVEDSQPHTYRNRHRLAAGGAAHRRDERLRGLHQDMDNGRAVDAANVSHHA